MKCLIYISIGAKYLVSARGLQSNYSKHKSQLQLAQPISQATLTRDNELGNRLLIKLNDTNLVAIIHAHTKSNFIEVVDLSLILLGSFLRNETDITGQITNIFLDVVSFQSMYEIIAN